MVNNILLKPEWQVASTVHAFSSTRLGGVSPAPYASLNLGDHVNDDPVNVAKNRDLLRQYAQLPSDPIWLQQVHGTQIVTLTGADQQNQVADGVYTRCKDQVCAVMTADCLPVLFCSTTGDEVAAAHAGWRGLCDGVLEQTVAHFQAPADQIIAWLGPAIGPTQFIVGTDVKQRFMAIDRQAEQAFHAYHDKFLANIYLLARQRLQRLGIKQIYGGHACTVTDTPHFFSYRRDGQTGRMASLIWIS